MKLPAAPKRGFTLVEVIVFISVLSVAVVGLIASVSYSSLLLADAQHKVVATRFSEELSEWMKFQREYYGFSRLTSQITAGGTATYCFNSESDLSWPGTTNQGACSSFALVNYYRRQVILTQSGQELTARVTTSYQQLGRTKNVTITTIFNDYQQ